MAGIVSFGPNSSNRPITVNQQTVTGGGDTSGLVPYTGATGDVNLGTHSVIAHSVKADATDGLLLESANGTGIGLLGPANTANVSWYGSHIYSLMTEGSVPYFGASGLLSQDNQNLRWDSTDKRLSLFTSLGTEVLTNGSFTGSATGWTVGSGWAYSSNSVSHTSNGTAALSQTAAVPAFREHLLTYTVSGLTAGTVNVTLTMTTGSYTGPTRSANGTYSERIHLSYPATALNFVPSNTARLTIDTVSLKPLTGSNIRSNLNTGGLSVEGSWSNSTPGTTRAQTFSNDGSYTWTDYRFAGTLRGAFGYNSSGGMDLYASGGNYFGFYQGNAGLTSTSLFAYLYPTAFVHYGYGEFLGGVIAGSIQQPTSTLQSTGSLGLKVKRVIANTTLDNTATHWLVDATNASACTGTPSVTDCSTYTASGQATCESHLPCAWFAGYACSAYNGEYGMGTCAGQTGCTVETVSCTGATDQTSCEAQDDSYGGSCAWGNDPQSCAGFDQSTCNSTTGCTANADDCANYSDGGGDGTACNAANGGSYCSYDSGTGACSGGSFGFLSCSGTYDNYVCSGTYNTGNCNGTYGTSCSGTVTCASYGSSGACNAEAGCTWSTTLNLTLPDGGTCPDRTYWIKNDTPSGADVNLIPYSGQTIDKLATLTLANYGDAVHIAYFTQTYDCANYLTEGACTPTGCTKNYSSCSWDSIDSTCSGHASCTGIGDQSTCESTTYFSSCSGTEVVQKNWYVFGNV